MDPINEAANLGCLIGHFGTGYGWVWWLYGVESNVHDTPEAAARDFLCRYGPMARRTSRMYGRRNVPVPPYSDSPLQGAALVAWREERGIAVSDLAHAMGVSERGITA